MEEERLVRQKKQRIKEALERYVQQSAWEQARRVGDQATGLRSAEDVEKARRTAEERFQAALRQVEEESRTKEAPVRAAQARREVQQRERFAPPSTGHFNSHPPLLSERARAAAREARSHSAAPAPVSSPGLTSPPRKDYRETYFHLAAAPPTG